MLRRLLTLAVMYGFAANLVAAPPPRAEGKPDALVALLEVLHEPVELPRADGGFSLRELSQFAAARLGSPVLLSPDIVTDEVARFHSVAGKLPLRKSLGSVLAQQNLTYLVRKDHLEIVPITAAARETKARLDNAAPSPRFAVPLVSAVIREKSLQDAVAAIADDNDVTVVIAPRAGDAKAIPVSARLLNVPLDRALEVLALQADLAVVPLANTLVLTTPEHADQLAESELQRERHKSNLKEIRREPFVIPRAAVPEIPAAKEPAKKQKKQKKGKKPATPE